MAVFVYKTSVQFPVEVRQLSAGLNQLAGQGNWNFDLDDCDRVLRIVSQSLGPQAAIQLLESTGFECAELEDLVSALTYNP